MGFRSYKDATREVDWGCTSDGGLTLRQINAGALLRIADAVEKSCADREQLERRVKWLTEERDGLIRALNTERRRSAALRGVIARMKAARVAEDRDR